MIFVVIIRISKTWDSAGTSFPRDYSPVSVLQCVWYIDIDINPEYPQIAPHAGKKIYVGGIETLGSLSLYLWCGTFIHFSLKMKYFRL